MKTSVKISAILLFTLSLLACPKGPGIIPEEKKPESNTLKIATYNILDFEDDHYQNVADFIKKHKIEVIVFEEIQPADIAPLKKVLLPAYKKAFGEYISTVQCSSEEGTDNSDRNDDVIAFSIYPIEDISLISSGSTIDPATNSYTQPPRDILRFKVTVNSKELWIYSGHLKSGVDESSQVKRRAQASSLREYITANHNILTENIVILGDMNTMGDNTDRDGGLIGPSDFITNQLDYDITGGSPSTIGTMGHLLMRADTDDANDFYSVNYEFYPNTRTHEYKPYAYLSVLDHIIVSPNLWINISKDGVFIDDAMDPYSDHWPIICELSL